MRVLPTGDSGAADPRLRQALSAWTARGTTSTGHAATGTAALTAEVHASLAGARVFVAITATSTATSTAEHVSENTGLRAESSAEMALLTILGSAGDRALPVFLDAAGAVAFRPGARPVPLPATDVCAAALQDGVVALLLDPPGAAFPVIGASLADLAAGRVPIAGTALSARRVVVALTSPREVDPGLVRAVGKALQDEPVRAARLLDGPDGPVLGLVPERSLDAAALAALAARVLPRLEGSLPGGGIDVTVIPQSGPGRAVPLGRRSAPPGARVSGWLRRGR